MVQKVEMTSSEWQLSLKLVDQPKSTFHFPEMMPGDVPPGGYRVATLKQLVAAQLPDSIPEPELIGLFRPSRLCKLVVETHGVNTICVVLCSRVTPELVHCGRKLKDELTLDACGIQSGSTIHILKKSWPEPESSAGACHWK